VRAVGKYLSARTYPTLTTANQKKVKTMKYKQRESRPEDKRDPDANNYELVEIEGQPGFYEEVHADELIKEAPAMKKKTRKRRITPRPARQELL
jgi:hypothetical protein